MEILDDSSVLRESYVDSLGSREFEVDSLADRESVHNGTLL